MTTHKEVKVVRWGESDGGRWSQVLGVTGELRAGTQHEFS